MDLLATSHRSACELVVVMRIDSLCAKLGFVSCAVLCSAAACAVLSAVHVNVWRARDAKHHLIVQT